jgi:hypothetical protein
MHTDITWTDQAWERFKEVGIHNAEIRAYYGDAIADEHEAEFLRTFQRITFAAGPVNVQQDGQGFYITTPYIVIGLVWSVDSDDRRRQRLARVGFHYDAENTTGWPATGHWSAHS